MTTTSTFNSWIFMARRKPQARLRLFCFPHAGSGASGYHPWLNAFPPEIEVCPVQLPGRENRLQEPLFRQFDPLIARLAEALHSYFTMPFAFFGHSMGALISFGLARYLREQKENLPVHLFVSAYRAPQIPNVEKLHLLPDAAFMKKLLTLNGTKPEILENTELRQFLFPILRADFAVCETFRYVDEEPFSCPISAFSGLQDTRARQEDLLAWQAMTSGTFTHYPFPGNHFFLQHPQIRTSLVQTISKELAPYIECLTSDQY